MWVSKEYKELKIKKFKLKLKLNHFSKIIKMIQNNLFHT